ncbi:hypothetical protein WICPIJ_006280 [Wickerhamomyces pijperi]|uniref:BHLH domain-containing protein n=1 Tax=Wickerhamomyces pijperi TaxID=599730 RepID=A0A9P8TL60_WICPI|nr:hypothetical protein WICPIJ_006280 [Wickerhamomyces pijperi]
MEDHLDSSISRSHHTVPSLDINTMRLSIPAPPDLKPTIIQMQASNSINGPDDYQNQGMANGLSAPQPQKRRRRRSSTSLASITPSELAQRQKEHKTAHSNIEKKRRIKMNREFEALKFLIPAIRNNLIGANGETSGTLSNGEQLYNLTILQSSVDYIRYLHKVILAQEQALNELTGHAENGESAGLDDALSFANVDINTESYRSNLEAEFDFKKIFESFKIMQSPMLRANSNNRMSNTSPSLRASFDSYHHLPPPMSAVAGQMNFNNSSSNSNSNNRIRTGSLPNPSLSVAVSGLNSNASSTKTTPLLSAVPSPLISPTLQGKLPSSSASLNSNINSSNFQFQFPLMSKSSLSTTSNGSTSGTNATNSASSSALSYSSNLTPVLSSMTNGNVNDYQNELNNNKESNMISSVSFELPSSALPPITLPTSSTVSFSTNTNSTYTASSSSSLNSNRSVRVPSSVLSGVHSSSNSNSNGSSSRSSTSSNGSSSGIGFQQGIPVNIGTGLNDNRASSRSPSNVGVVVNASGGVVTSNTGSLRSLLN